MELAYHLFAGATAAVLAGLFNTVAAPLVARLQRRSQGEWRAPTLLSQFTALFIYLLIGTGLGLLFWLSWGLTAIVGVPWWVRGSGFALILWVVCCLPLLTLQLLALRTHWSTAAIFAIEWLVILVAVGLACAWNWAKTP